MRRVITAADSASGRLHPVESPHDKVDRTRPIANGLRPLIPYREVVSRNRNERSGFSREGTGNRPRTSRGDRALVTRDKKQRGIVCHGVAHVTEI